MALRLNPTYRQRRFGEEVRRLRERAGLSSTEAAALLGIKQPQLSNAEAGKTSLAPERVRRLAAATGATNSPLVDALIDLGERSGKGWWTDYRKSLGTSHLDLAELEAGARCLRNYELLFVPGLLQTSAYAAAIQGGGYGKVLSEVRGEAVEFRIERQRILHGERPPRFHAVIHEAALRVLYGGREVMRDQLLRLIELSRLPHVTIQVVPLEDEGRAAFSHSFMVVAPGEAWLGTVLVDQLGASHFLGSPEEVAEYAESFDKLSGLALPSIDAEAVPEARTAKDSLGLIQHILYPLL